jgi:hypothetical protein
MTKDNSTSKNKEFYDLGKKMFDRLNPHIAHNPKVVGPEQKPVAWMFQHEETGRMNYVSNDGIHNPAMFLEMNPRYALVCPLYTTPPQRPWVGLTDGEVVDCWPGFAMYVDCAKFWKNIEAKLKEKNEH